MQCVAVVFLLHLPWKRHSKDYMDVITRNFLRLLRSGALNEYQQLEPMSAFKWHRVVDMARYQGVGGIVAKGMRNHQYDGGGGVPHGVGELLKSLPPAENPLPVDETRLSNTILNRRLEAIREGEPQSEEPSEATLELLDVIVANVAATLNSGLSLSRVLELGGYLRTSGDKVDFVKLDRWLSHLHIARLAQLHGSVLVEVFGFDQDEVPFVKYVERSAARLAAKAICHTAKDTAETWYFRKTRSGFVRNNSKAIRRNIRRSAAFAKYAPVETISSFADNAFRSLSEIEE